MPLNALHIISPKGLNSISKPQISLTWLRDPFSTFTSVWGKEVIALMGTHKDSSFYPWAFEDIILQICT